MSEDTPNNDTIEEADDELRDGNLPARKENFDPRIIVDTSNDTVRHQLRGMYQSWFLDYASYVILERAVPNIEDGLKPVQRRILHSMKLLDDGRFNKVANIVGHTMQFHPHGDASIYEALVQLGQKELLVETQGNWGNTLTGASAAAGRYIEARLSQFALDVVYNPKVTDWTLSYDGRKKEPITLPVKFPLLLSKGAEGIAVGLSSKILPHNFNEIIDAAIAYLRGEEFTLYPDFFTGGFIDVSRYNDGERGGVVKIRAKIEKIDNKTLAITEIPYGKTTATLIESIIKAQEAGKIKIRSVDDNTGEHANVIVYLQPGTSSDKTIDALYAFTDCEVSISPNCCVISDNKPHFVGVSDVLRHNVDSTRTILGKELRIQLDEVREQLHFASLERIFIEERIYKDKGYEESENRAQAIDHIRGRLEKYRDQFIREVTDDDIIRLFEIKMGRILKFNADKCDEQIAAFRDRIADLSSKLERLTEYTIEWYENLQRKYGDAYPRMTVLRNFDNIQAASVAEANEKLYINREEGFIGTALKKDEFLCNCSSIDDVIIFYKDGRYKVVRVQEKLFIDKNVLHVDVFKRNDKRTVYNVIYQDGKGGTYYMKRFFVTGITRDKEYNLTAGKPGSRVCWFTVNPNGEAEVLKVYFKPRPRLKRVIVDLDFSTLAIKGRQSQGNLFSRYGIHKIVLKERGTSTLGGQQIWFDEDVRRLNADGRGRLLGEFKGDDRLLVWTSKNQYYITGYDLGQHFPDETVRVEKYVAERVYSLCYFDREQRYYYLKRFPIEASDRMQFFLDEQGQADFVAMTDRTGALLRIEYGGANASRPADEIDVDEFVGVKSHRAKGKRLTTYEVASLAFIEPELPEEPEPAAPAEPEADSPQEGIPDGAESGGAGPAEEAGGAAFEIERARGDVDEVIDPEQLNLF